MGKAHRNARPKGLTDDLGHWLAGFIDGEGSFAIHKESNGSYRCSFYLKLRDDDSEIVREVHERVGLGSIYAVRARAGRQSQICWAIQDRAGCLLLCELLDNYPLRAKKKRDFQIWKEAVRVWVRVRSGGARGKGLGRGTGRHPESAAAFKEMGILHSKIREVRSYAMTTDLEEE